MTGFPFTELLPLGPDETTYRLISSEGVGTLEAGGHRLNQRVAPAVAEAVDDDVEAVQVQQQDRHAHAAAVGRVQYMLQLFLEQAPVRKTGERVAIGLMDEPFLSTLAFGDV